jgi:predicted nucleotidyltransferase
VNEITPEEMQGYVDGFRARCALAEGRRRELEAGALAAVERWVERLQRVPGVRRIILYGSLAKGTFREGSDVDLAVEGLAAVDHFRLWAELERDESFRLDLHRWEELSEGLREVVGSYGRVLYAKP